MTVRQRNQLRHLFAQQISFRSYDAIACVVLAPPEKVKQFFRRMRARSREREARRSLFVEIGKTSQLRELEDRHLGLLLYRSLGLHWVSSTASCSCPSVFPSQVVASFARARCSCQPRGRARHVASGAPRRRREGFCPCDPRREVFARQCCSRYFGRLQASLPISSAAGRSATTHQPTAHVACFQSLLLIERKALFFK